MRAFGGAAKSAWQGTSVTLAASGYVDSASGDWTLKRAGTIVATVAAALFAVTGSITASAGVTVSSGSLTVTGGTITTGAATNLSLATSGGTQLVAEHTANVVNHALVTGGIAGAGVQVAVAGSDSTVATFIYAKGAANITFRTNRQSGAVDQFSVTHTASAVNYIEATGNATASPPLVRASGSDTNIQLNLLAKGTGGVALYTNNGTAQFYVSHTASAVNYHQYTGAATGSAPYSVFTGSDSNVSGSIVTKGSGSINFKTNDGGSHLTQFVVTHSASATNYVQVSGTNGGAPYVAAQGADTNISLNIITKGTGAHQFVSANGSVTNFMAGSTSSGVNYAQINPASTGNDPLFFAQGSDTNVALFFLSKGSDSLVFQTNLGTTQMMVTHTASAVNYHSFTGAATGGNVYDLAAGSDSNINLLLISKGSGYVGFYTNGGTLQCRVSHVASAVNYLTIQGAATGGQVTVYAEGSDANVALWLAQKGTAVLKMTGQTVQTTVGAAGGASAQPATPLGYLVVNVNGLGNVAIPYHNAA